MVRQQWSTRAWRLIAKTKTTVDNGKGGDGKGNVNNSGDNDGGDEDGDVKPMDGDVKPMDRFVQFVKPLMVSKGGEGGDPCGGRQGKEGMEPKGDPCEKEVDQRQQWQIRSFPASIFVLFYSFLFFSFVGTRPDRVRGS